MSNNLVSLASTFGPLIGDAQAGFALIMPGVRSIGDLYPHVVVEETHADELAITQHPVEFGTPVTDHAFMQPYSVEIRCGWSDANAQTSGYVKAVYKAFLGLQASRVPFAITTGKRAYTSMLLETLLVKTDPESEYALMCIATAKQIVITSTQMAAASAANTNGSQPVASFNAPGMVGSPPVVAGSNGIGTLPPNAVTADGFGNYSFPNDLSAVGTQNLTASNQAAPSF